MKGFKFVEILRMVFNKFDGDVTITKTAYFKSKTKTVINENDINLDLLDSSQDIKNKILVGYLKAPVGLLIQSIIIISTLLNTTPQKDRHLKIPSELRNFTKGLINLKNEDDQCLQCCHIRHLNAQGSVTLKTPAYVGMCILDLSQTLTYDSRYNCIVKKFGDKAKLLFTDTVSLTYEIEIEDVHQDFWNDENKFDNSDYPENSIF